MDTPIRVEGTTETRTPEQAARAAPVTLPAGSYDSAELQSKLDAASKAKTDEARGEAVDKAVAELNQNPSAAADPGLPAGHRRVDVDVADLGITESRVVFDPASAGETAAAPAPSIPAAEAAAASKGE